ncbi:MAG: hypothetical protein PHH85_14625 [Candidatus Methanoperedens sp.]|nr:hypothetical protein [Candidatus Methanoperedens sp.]
MIGLKSITLPGELQVRNNALIEILKENNADYSQKYSLIIKENGEVTVKDIDREIYIFNYDLPRK